MIIGSEYEHTQPLFLGGQEGPTGAWTKGVTSKLCILGG